MEIQQLKGFHAVAKFKNFTTAAKKTYRTQPTISLQVKGLEDELGVKLFERLGPNNVHLTPEGRILYDLTAPIVEDLDTLKVRFDELRGQHQAATVTMVTHTSIMVHLLPRVVRQFKTQFPNTQLIILNRTRDEIIELLESGEADFGVTSLPQVPQNLQYEVFHEFDRILITTKKHPLSKKNSVSLKDLAEFPLILPTRESNTRQLIDDIFKSHGLDLNVTMEVLGREAVKIYVGMNLGISIINEYYVTKVDQEKLYVKNLSHFFGKARLGIVVRKRKYLSQSAQTLMRMVAEHDYSIGS